MGNNGNAPRNGYRFSTEQKEGNLVVVLLLPVIGGLRLLHIGQFDETTPDGLGNLCPKICFCLRLYSHMPFLLDIRGCSGDGKKIRP